MGQRGGVGWMRRMGHAEQKHAKWHPEMGVWVLIWAHYERKGFGDVPKVKTEIGVLFGLL